MFLVGKIVGSFCSQNASGVFKHQISSHTSLEDVWTQKKHGSWRWGFVCSTINPALIFWKGFLMILRLVQFYNPWTGERLFHGFCCKQKHINITSCPQKWDSIHQMKLHYFLKLPKETPKEILRIISNMLTLSETNICPKNWGGWKMIFPFKRGL